MEKLTYRQAYDKIIDAYFKDEIEPSRKSFCFCGTLAPNSHWAHQRNWDGAMIKYPYTGEEYAAMEQALFSPFPGVKILGTGLIEGFNGIKERSDYEALLFSGMTAALEVLKQIHRDRGEDVDEVPGLTKRTLVPIT